MTSGRSKRTKYPLRELPSQDYHRQLQGPPISRRALTTTIEKATPESIAANGEKGEATQRETNMTTELDQIDTLIALLAQRRDEKCQRREEERQRLGQQRQRREEEKTLTVVTGAQEERIAQERKDPI